MSKFHAYKTIHVSALRPYERNARTHSDEQVAQLRASIKRFGFTNPLLIDEHNVIIAGHGRVEAAKAEGLTEVPCIVVTGLTDAERRALTLADNKLALNAGWDLEMLTAELRGLADEGFDLGLTGFSAEEIDNLLDPEVVEGENDPDDAPGVEVETVSKPGDVWVLGPHRIMCGDSTSIADVDRLMAGAPADVCWTDPPYNVAYEGSAGKIKNDDMSDAKFREFLQEAYGCMFAHLKEGAAVYVAHADTEGLNFRAAFRDAGFKLSGCLIWRKESLVLGRSDYQWQHEPILYGWKPGSKHRWYGGRKQTTIQQVGEGSPFKQLDDGRWTVQVGDRVMIVSGEATVEEVVPSIINESKPKRSAEHPTMKPVALIERMLKHSARSGDIVLDLFGGSGSTLIAADRMGMCARLMELDPKFADVIVRRWEGFTGRKATLESDGRTFSEVAGAVA